METNRKFTVLKLLVLGALVAGLHAKPASAQLIQGKFTLPFTARWRATTLPSGEYSFKLDTLADHGAVQLYRGTRGVALILAQCIGDNRSDRSKMVLENGTVRELSLPQIGATLYYPAPNPRHRAAPEQPQVAQIIPVAVAGAGR
jgi:hypothetical protein